MLSYGTHSLTHTHTLVLGERPPSGRTDAPQANSGGNMFALIRLLSRYILISG